jgi:uncharacterized membrane protein
MVVMDTTPEPSAPLLELTLRPHRSLSPAGFWAIMTVLIALSFAGGVVFWSIGAWPVIGFVGLDVALVYWAFKASYAAGRAREELRLTPETLIIRRIAASGRAHEVVLPPNWLKVEIDRPRGRTTQLRLSTHGRTVTIGAFLPPEEREAVADVLRAALARMRAAPGLG